MPSFIYLCANWRNRPGSAPSAELPRSGEALQSEAGTSRKGAPYGQGLGLTRYPSNWCPSLPFLLLVGRVPLRKQTGKKCTLVRTSLLEDLVKGMSLTSDVRRKHVPCHGKHDFARHTATTVIYIIFII